LQQRLLFASLSITLVEYGVIDGASAPMLPLAITAWEAVMKLSGQISIELTVDDFVAAADHQRRLEGLLTLIRDSYPDATLAMRERRERKGMSLPRAVARAVGAHARYSAG
jgi:hypothetical protein